MRWSLLLTGLFCLAIGGAATVFYSKGNTEDQQAHMRRLLRVQLRDFTNDVSLNINKASALFERSIRETMKSGEKFRLRESDALRFVMFSKVSNLDPIFAKGHVVSPGLEKAVQKHFKAKENFSIYKSKGQSYLLWRKKFRNRLSVAAFDYQRLFSFTQKSNSFRPWVATSEGVIAYHGRSNLVGGTYSNLRPIAVGMKDVKAGKKLENLSVYAGIDGEETLGAWQSMPKFGLITGVRWPKAWSQRAGSGFLFWLAPIFLLAGAFLTGFAMRAQPINVVSKRRETKELAPELRQIVDNAVKSAESSLDYAREKEEQCLELESRAREQLVYAERMRWIYERTERFFDRIVDVNSVEGVWDILGDNLYEMSMSSPLVIYQYSPASCSLAPVNSKGVEEFTDSAKRYIEDSRILMGEYHHINVLTKTKAYERWEQRLGRHLDMEKYNPFALPFSSPTGAKGAVLFLFEEGKDGEGELKKQRELWSVFAFRAAWLYDMKKRLIQANHGKQQQITTSNRVASSTDSLGDQSS